MKDGRSARPRGSIRDVAAWCIVAALLILIPPRSAMPATNQAVDAGGGSVSLSPSGPLVVNAVTLGLVKQARDLTGVVLPGGAPVLPGQSLYFVLIVDNTTPVFAADLRLTDQLDETQFRYVAGSLETVTAPSGSSDAAVWAAAWSGLTDSVGGPDDLGSVTDTGGAAGGDRVTMGAVAAQANQPLDVAPNTLRAVRFRVIVQ